MIDAERILGSLVRNAMGGSSHGRRRRRRRRSGRSLLGGAGKGALALGVLGVAMGAFEHFSQQKKGSGSVQDGGGGTAQGGSEPPLPPLPEAAPPADLPPLPGRDAGPSKAPHEPMAEAATEARQAEALLLIRAMIAAANADHEVDAAERERISEALEEADLSAEERAFLEAEMEEPLDAGALAAAVGTPELAEQVYLASLMAIEVDNRAERDYLRRLAERLELTPARVGELESLLPSADG